MAHQSTSLLSRTRRGLGKRGAMTIEFALIVSFGFLPIVFAIFDWSWYFWQASLVQTALWQAAREGASAVSRSAAARSRGLRSCSRSRMRSSARRGSPAPRRAG